MTIIYEIKDAYPQLQTSMGGPYLSSPNNNSGGLYQRVITLFVYGLVLSSALYSLARPKSASFICPLWEKTKVIYKK